MKNFLQHLSEAQKTYDFRIKVANIDPADCMDRLKSALESYSIVEVGAVKRLPIQENVIEFPNMGPTEVFLIDVSLAYPCTSAQLRQLVAERCNLPSANIFTVPRNHPEELWRNGEGELREYVQGETVIDKPYPEADAEQKAASKAYSGAESILKELTHKVEWDVAGSDSADAKTLNDVPTNNASPVGSKQNKLPSAK